ncbi:MAG: response regulator transcription factor [Lactobacillaceae bacterium]
MANILVIDDEPSILEIIKIGMEKDGHYVTALDNSEEISNKILKFYDIILLDIMMPKKDGYSVLEDIRGITDCPIIFLTANSGENSVMRGLELGADDYLTKPFRISELRARINAHIRREKREHCVIMNIDNFRFDLEKKEVYFKNELMIFTKGEYEICEYLAKNRQRIFTKEQIYDAVFGYEAEGDSKSIATHVKNIRQKFDEPEECPIKTKWGIGYLWR